MGIWEIRTAVGKKYSPVLPIHLFISSHFHMHKLPPTEGPTFKSAYFKWFLTWEETGHRTTVCGSKNKTPEMTAQCGNGTAGSPRLILV